MRGSLPRRAKRNSGSHSCTIKLNASCLTLKAKKHYALSVSAFLLILFLSTRVRRKSRCHEKLLSGSKKTLKYFYYFNSSSKNFAVWLSLLPTICSGVPSNKNSAAAITAFGTKINEYDRLLLLHQDCVQSPAQCFPDLRVY